MYFSLLKNIINQKGGTMKVFFVAVLFLFFSSQAFCEDLTLLIGVDKNSQGYRIAVKLIDTISQKTGDDFVIKYAPMPRLRNEVKKDNSDYAGFPVMMAGFEKLNVNLIKVAEPFIKTPYVAVAQKELPVDGWESLKPYKLTHLRGSKIVEFNLNKTGLKSHPINNVTQALKFVLGGRADIFIIAPLLVMKELQKPQFKDTGLRILKPPIAVFDIYTYFFKEYEEIAERYNKALKEMKADGTYKTIMLTTP